MKHPAFVMIITILLCYLMKISSALDTIVPNQTLHDNGSTLISSRGKFELGFFPGNFKNRYAGIWFKNIPERTVVWVANRDKPLTDSSGTLTVTSSGNIVILNNQSTVPVWSSNSTTNARYPTLQLLDTGNLAVKDVDAGNYIWQSFDHPCDTLIAGMKLGLNLQTGQSWALNSWKTPLDPSAGDYWYKVEAKGLPQLKVSNGNGVVKHRSGPWDGDQFGDSEPNHAIQRLTASFILNSTHVYFTFQDKNKSISRTVLDQAGSLGVNVWNYRTNEWVNILRLRQDQCNAYARCGPNGLCNPNRLPICLCLPGFMPRVQADWDTEDWQEGCKRKRKTDCSEDVGFIKYSMMKLPDNSLILKKYSIVMDLEQCKYYCLRNCSCVAYARTEASGCVVWIGDLLDIEEYSIYGQDLYIKVPASELESKKQNKGIVVIISISLISGTVLLALVSYFVPRKNRASKTREDLIAEHLQQDFPPSAGEDLDLPIFDFKALAIATNNFSSTNKIGKGGFGSVYKGVLSTGQEIAVKRLSKDSGQGIQEFKNEVIFISKLQHRNLVRLLGCCIHKEERMLIYEYMPKGSLDSYIFDENKATSLDWKMRFEIIVGIARGLLYLHRDSRLRIIHRDLKASNILLDDHMNPKISDFGLARIFCSDQTEANTLRIMGTYGYMSPEYAIDGVFSTKSDVFSFGVLILEILSGQKNRGFCHPNHDLNLLGHVWNLWNESQPMELIEHYLEETISISELLRCIQVGLLCVQQGLEDRPAMSSVLLMLDSENASLPQPKQPAYYTGRHLADKDTSSSNAISYTGNEVTLTMPLGR